MKTAERIVIVGLLLAFVGIGYAGYYAVQNKRADLRAEVAAGEFEIPDVDPMQVAADEDKNDPVNWRRFYPNTIPVTLADVPVLASVADTMSTRIKGLSNTPYLPDNVIKLFAFGVPGSHSIWMKDMNYSIDIIWIAEEGQIVHIEENVSPDTFPQSFSSPAPAWFVVETNSGFVDTHDVEVGDELVIPLP
ncbi:MAG: uncharacterized membrane protein (UPF0127 family) [Candidatus Paceibacteria bacterium]|jgi:uncharacterized membrane protein (UPF0127 family)